MSDKIAHIYDWLRREQGFTASEADDVLAGRAALRSDSPVRGQWFGIVTPDDEFIRYGNKTHARLDAVDGDRVVELIVRDLLPRPQVGDPNPNGG